MPPLQNRCHCPSAAPPRRPDHTHLRWRHNRDRNDRVKLCDHAYVREGMLKRYCARTHTSMAPAAPPGKPWCCLREGERRQDCHSCRPPGAPRSRPRAGRSRPEPAGAGRSPAGLPGAHSTKSPPEPAGAGLRGSPGPIEAQRAPRSRPEPQASNPARNAKCRRNAGCRIPAVALPCPQ